MPIRTPFEARPLHGFNLRYLFLVIYVWFLRCLAYLEVYLTNHLRPLPGPDVTVSKVWFPSRDKGRKIFANIYRPVGLKEESMPVHINVHGSGFAIPAFFGNSRYFCYVLAKLLQCVVIDTDYRKAPENPFPRGSIDVSDCILWVHSQPQRYDLSRVTLSGFSAGANLAMSALQQITPGMIKAIIAFYPPSDATSSYACLGVRRFPHKMFRSGVQLASNVFTLFNSAFVQRHVDPSVSTLSVLYTPIENIPDYGLFVSGAADMYMDTVEIYNRIQSLGTPAQKAGHRFLGIPNEAHAFDEQPKTPESVWWRDYTFAASVETIRGAWRTVAAAKEGRTEFGNLVVSNFCFEETDDPIRREILFGTNEQCNYSVRLHEELERSMDHNGPTLTRSIMYGEGATLTKDPRAKQLFEAAGLPEPKLDLLVKEKNPAVAFSLANLPGQRTH